MAALFISELEANPSRLARHLREIGAQARIADHRPAKRNEEANAEAGNGAGDKAGDQQHAAAGAIGLLIFGISGGFLGFGFSFRPSPVWIIGQALVNIGVVIGLLPVMGLPLPLVSAGGSAMISTLLALGIMLSKAFKEEQSSLSNRATATCSGCSLGAG